MDPQLINALIGNLSVNPTFDISKHNASSPGANSRIRNGDQFNQIQINVLGGNSNSQTTIDVKDLNKEKSETFKQGYQAVFLDNDQVYFGKLQKIGQNKFVQLKEIFYLDSSLTTLTNTNASISLIKLGNEVHGPQDAMSINVGRIMFWENLKDDSLVVKSIKDYYKTLKINVSN